MVISISSTSFCMSCLKVCCTGLCPMAEAYANQDYKPKSELTISELFSKPDAFLRTGNIRPWPEFKEKPLYTPKEREILRALLKFSTRKEIAGHLNISRAALRKHIYSIRKKRYQLYIK